MLALRQPYKDTGLKFGGKSDKASTESANTRTVDMENAIARRLTLDQRAATGDVDLRMVCARSFTRKGPRIAHSAHG